jgi:electron transport complex protein RnfG
VAEDSVARDMGIAALILTGFAIASTGLVALTYTSTRDSIDAAQRAALEASLNALIPADRYDNRLIEDRITVTDPVALGTPEPVVVYRARKAGQSVALLATTVAPDGYSGPIRLLIGVYADGTLAGVRVLSHQETPGLGDGIDLKRSTWILSFTGKSLDNPESDGWKVKKDGGIFDQFTGATITPRAVVKAIRKFLEYLKAHRDQLFAPAASKENAA